MEVKAQRLFEAFQMFRKLHFHYLSKDLTHSEFAIMKCIAYGKCHRFDKREHPIEGNISISKLARMIHVSAPSISRTIKAMEEKGYIVRHINMEDRRNAYVELTDFGKETLLNAQNMVEEFTSLVLDQMDQSHLDDLITYLEDLYTISEKELEKRKINRKDI